MTLTQKTMWFPAAKYKDSTLRLCAKTENKADQIKDLKRHSAQNRFLLTHSLTLCDSENKQFQKLSTKQWPKNGHLALNVDIRVAQKWPSGTEGVNVTFHECKHIMWWGVGSDSGCLFEGISEEYTFATCFLGSIYDTYFNKWVFPVPHCPVIMTLCP